MAVSVNEAMLIILMKNFDTKYQRTLVLEKYVQHYGGLSEKAWQKVKELIAEGADDDSK